MMEIEATEARLCKCGCGNPAPAYKGKQIRQFIYGHMTEWLTRSGCDSARYQREYRRQRYESMAEDDKSAKEERIRRSRFDGRPVWNKGKKTGLVPWDFGLDRTNEVKEKIRESVKEAWRNGKYSLRKGTEWKWDLCSDVAGRARARKKYSLIGMCEKCQTREAAHRHHVDGDTRNNERENVEFLCRAGHKKAHRK